MCKVIAIANQKGGVDQNNDNHQSGSRTDKEWEKSSAGRCRSAGTSDNGNGISQKSQSDFKEYDGKYHHGTGV